MLRARSASFLFFFVLLSSCVLLLPCLVTSSARAQEQAPTLPFDRYIEPIEPAKPSRPSKPPTREKTYDRDTEPIEPAKPSLPSKPEKTYESYGWPMVLVDAGAFALWAATLANENQIVARATLGNSLGLYGLVPPIIHVLNAEPLRGLGSFGLRIGAPVVGALFAEVLAFIVAAANGNNIIHNDRESEKPQVAAALAGATLGALTAAAFDDFYFARHRVR